MLRLGAHYGVGQGPWPPELNYLALAKRMGVPAHELLGYDYMPAFIVDDEMMVMQAEAEHAPREGS